MVKRRSGHEGKALCLLLGLALVHCTPDFDSLTSGSGDRGGAAPAGGAGAAGTSATGGSSNGGDVTNGGNAGGQPFGGGTAGKAPVGTAGGEPSAGAPNEGGGGQGGDGGAPPDCTFVHPAASIYTAFTGGLEGPGFAMASTTSSPGSTLGATASSAWDGTTGNSCPGALHLAALFKGYASGTAPDEVINVDLRFSGANWTGAVALHAWVKVAPVAVPLKGVQLFVISGASFLYASVFEDKAFDGGSWYEMVLPLEAGATFDPSSVRRIGLQLLLEREGTAGNPTSPPAIDVWLDDVWVEN